MAAERQHRGRPVNRTATAARSVWDFSEVADGHVYLLRRGRDFDIEVASLAQAARRWARRHDCRLTTRSLFEDRGERRRKAGLYVQFQRRA